MASDKTDTKATETKTPAAPEAPAAATAATTPANGASQIVEQGELPELAPAPAEIGAAGLYKVTHGSISFGNGQTALMGATIYLSAAEASLMLPLGVIEAK